MPWQMGPVTVIVPLGAMGPVSTPLRAMPAGAFPVPETMEPDDLPPAVRAAMLRPLDGPPKPAVTLAVMNATQCSMIAPDLPFKSNV